MTDVLIKPAFQSAYVDSGDTTKFGPNAWNAARLFSGGALGDLLVRDTGAATGASYLPDVAKGSLLISGGVGAVPVWSVVGAAGQSLVRDTGQASGFLWAERSRVLTVSTTQVGTDANLNEKDLWSYSLPANTLNADGRAVRIEAWGTGAANANAKTVNFYIGGTVFVAATAQTSNPLVWRVFATLIRTGAAAEVLNASMTHGIGSNGVQTVRANVAAGAFDTTQGMIIKVTGTNGVAVANDILFRGAMVELLN